MYNPNSGLVKRLSNLTFLTRTDSCIRKERNIDRYFRDIVTKHTIRLNADLI
jgi:hypothetical protein